MTGRGAMRVAASGPAANRGPTALRVDAARWRDVDVTERRRRRVPGSRDGRRGGALLASRLLGERDGALVARPRGDPGEQRVAAQLELLEGEGDARQLRRRSGWAAMKPARLAPPGRARCPCGGRWSSRAPTRSRGPCVSVRCRWKSAAMGPSTSRGASCIPSRASDVDGPKTPPYLELSAHQQSVGVGRFGNDIRSGCAGR